ncbi:MAG TPA: hypothetical protein VM099_08455, partial [Gemmatimonadaceae bacterium]|nr:hypothetical protein [Gemmatimonadaceae bacterium]
MAIETPDNELDKAPEEAPDEARTFVGYFQHFPPIAGALVAIIGASVLAGWGLNIPALRGAFGNDATMMPSAAVCFIVGGLALILETARTPRPWAIIAARVLAVALILIALTTVLEHTLGRNLGLDLILFRDEVIATSP